MTQSHAVFMHRVGTEVSVSVRMDKLGKNVEIVDIEILCAEVYYGYNKGTDG